MAPCSVNANGESAGHGASGNRSQNATGSALCLLSGEPEHEILRKPCNVALDLLVQALGGDAVERGQVRIENDALTAQDQDSAGNLLALD